jgi:hypothetical protein
MKALRGPLLLIFFFGALSLSAGYFLIYPSEVYADHCGANSLGVLNQHGSFACDLYLAGNESNPAPTTGPGAQVPGAAVTNTNDSVETQNNCGLRNLNACFKEMMAYLMNAILSLFAYLLGLAGVFLNTVIIYTVVEMGRFLNGGADSPIGIAWSAFRDIANIVLIFTLLAIGIATILRVEGYGIGRLLPKVIIIAILLNFSIFITKAAVDVTNIVALQFYDSILVRAQQVAGGSTNIDGQGDFSGIIMSKLNLASVYKGTQASQSGGGGTTLISNTLDVSDIVLIGFAGSILFIIAAFVVFAAALSLVARFIVLIFLIALSPLAFVAMILPATQSYWKRWLDTFTKNALFAPIYMVLLWASLLVIDRMPVGTASFSQLMTEPANTGPLLLSFGIMIGLLIGSLMIAKELGAFGSAGALKGLQSLQKAGQGAITRGAGAATFGTAAFAGRNIIGFGANRAANRLASSSLKNTWIGKQAITGARSVGNASFDARASAPLKAASKAAGVDLGTASKQGYTGIREERTKAEIKYAKSLEPTEKEVADADAQVKAAEETGKVADKQMKAAQTQMNGIIRTYTEDKKNLDEAQDKYSKLKARREALQHEWERAQEAGDTVKMTTLDTEIKTVEANFKAADTALENIKTAFKPIEEQYNAAQTAVNDATRAVNEAGEEMKKAQANKKGIKSKPLKDWAEQLKTKDRWQIVGRGARIDAANKLLEEAKKGKSDKDKFKELLDEIKGDEDKPKKDADDDKDADKK